MSISKDQFGPMDQCAEDGLSSMMDSLESPLSKLNCASSVAGSVQDTSHETRQDAKNCVRDQMSDLTPEHVFSKSEQPVLDNPLYGTGLDPPLLTMTRREVSSDVRTCSKAEFSCILNNLGKKSDPTSECQDLGSSKGETELGKDYVERHNKRAASDQATENQAHVCRLSSKTEGERQSGSIDKLVDGVNRGEQSSLNLEYQCSNPGTTEDKYGCPEEPTNGPIVQNTDCGVKEKGRNCNDSTATRISSVSALDLNAVTQSTEGNENDANGTRIMGVQDDDHLKRMYNPCEIKHNSSKYDLKHDLKHTSKDLEPEHDQARNSPCQEVEHSSFEFLQSCFGLTSLDHSKLDQNAADVLLSGSAESCSQDSVSTRVRPPIPVGATLEFVPRGQTKVAGDDGMEPPISSTSSYISVSQEPEQQNDSKKNLRGLTGTKGAYDTGTKNRVTLSSDKLKKKLQPVVLVTSTKRNAKHGNAYVCAACQKHTQSLDELIEHHHCKHSKHAFQYCPTCGAYFSNRTSAAQHLCEQPGPKDVQQSDAVLSTTKPLTKKFKASYLCKYCQKPFVKTSYHQDHEQWHTTVTQYRCARCGLYFPHAKKLAVHKRKVKCTPLIREPNKQRKVCSEIDLKSPAKPAFTYGVDGCQIGFHGCFVKLVDINKKPSPQKINCPVCGKTFKLRAQLKLHLQSHTSSKPCKCYKCKRVFKYSWNLVKHKELCSGNIMKQHISQPSTTSRFLGRFACPTCPQIFAYSYNRIRHMRQRCLKEYMHTGKGKVGHRYKCPLCKETFSMACNRNRHIKKTCFQQYKLQKKTIKKLVKENVKEVKEEKQVFPIDNLPSFKCKVCSASFAHKSGVYRHMKKHRLIQSSTVQVDKNDSPTHVKGSDCINEAAEKQECSTQQTSDMETTHPFLCRFCDKGFDSSDLLNDHLQKHVGKKPFHCLDCDKNFARRGHLIVHRNVHKRRIQCSVCKKIVPTIGDLLKHRQSHNKKGMLQCPDCPMQFKFPVFLLRHVASHAKKEAIPKPSLPPEILSKKSAEEEKVKESKESLQCGICKKSFVDTKSMSEHCLTHLPKASVTVCPVCKHKFTSRTALVRHVRLHTGEKPFPCKTCGMHFHRKEVLAYHQLKCKGLQEKTPCLPSTTVETLEKCEVKSASKSIKVPKKFNCSYCPHVFTMTGNLKMHEKAHLANSLIPCLKCGKYYKRNKICGHRKFCNVKESTSTDTSHRVQAVKAEKSEHKGPSLVVTNRPSRITKIIGTNIDHFKERCPHCSKRFQYRSYLLRHLPSHLGKHNFACKYCGQKCNSQNSCQQHEALCNGMLGQHEEKQVNESKEIRDLPGGAAGLKGCKVILRKDGEQLKCNFCTKTFTKSRNLRRHILTHTDVKPYRCKTCENCFSRYDHLKYHQSRCRGRKQHSEVHIEQRAFDHVGSQAKGQPRSDIFKCSTCSRMFSSHSNLTRHVSLVHCTFKPFSCKICGTGFTAKDSLKRHSLRANCKMSSGKCLKPVQMPTKSNTSMQTCRETSKLMQRIEGHYSNKWKFPCEYCPRRFKNQTQLKMHTRLHTGEKPFGCSSCDERFIRRDYLKRHLIKCNGKNEGPKVLCDKCGGLFSLEALEMHLTNCTIGFKSPDCPASISNVSSSSKVKTFSCVNCNAQFLLFSQLQQHISIKHRYDALQSGILEQKQLSSNLHIKEEPVDENDAENLPSSCQINVNNGHENTAEGRERPFLCEQCNMRFITNAGLGMHMRTHTAIYPLSCKKCNKGFWSKNVQQKHVRRCKGLEMTKEEPTNAKDAVSLELECTSNEKVLVFNKVSNTTGTGVLQTKFSCKDQDQGTADKKGAVIHKYQCSECEQSFTDGLMLISHLEAHGREDQERRLGKSHRCHICSKTFDQAGILQRHVKTQHQENVKNTCPECFRSFRYPSDLDIHRSCHDPNRPFVCSTCELRFWTPKSLSTHQRAAHSTNEPLKTIESLKTDRVPPKVFTCQPCNKIYTIKRSYMKHCSIKHKGCSKNLEDLKDATTEHQLSNNESDGSDADDNDDDSDDSDSAPYFPCHVCGKTFVTSESLEDHQRCHLGEKPYECEECGKCFIQLVNLQQHQRSHKSEFQCQMCGKGFVSLFALRKHKHTHVRKRPHRCTKCHLSFTKSKQLKEHMATHREENFPCDLCHESFTCKSSRAEHRKIHTEAEEELPPLIPPAKQTSSPTVSITSSSTVQQYRYRCENCQVRFPDPEQLSEHGCNSAKERPYSCKDCNKHFLHGSHLKKHQLTHQLSGTRSFQCNSCHMSFSHRHHFLTHLQTHGGEESSKPQIDEVKTSNTEDSNQDRIYRCPICPESFSQVLELANHLSVHANMCNVCNKTFSTKQQLEKHEQSHLSAATQYECTECGKSFLGSDAFRQHYCVHQKNLSSSSLQTTDKKRCLKNSSELLANNHEEEEEVDVGEDFYNCPTCSKRFPSNISLQEHQKLHEFDRPFKCLVCGKGFAKKKYLTQHQQIHDERPYRCDLCSDSFKTEQSLLSHRKTHEAHRKYHCSVCDKSYRSAYDLSRHEHKHPELRSFSEASGDHRCDMCYKSFSLLSQLRQHQETHVGQVVYECTECDKAFAFLHLLEEHQQTHGTSADSFQSQSPSDICFQSPIIE